MNLINIKELSVLSLIFGAILGLATLIPYIGIITFLVCTFASGSIIVLYMQKMRLLGELEIKEWSINGAISGFVSFLGFSLTFIPLASLIGIVAKVNSYHWSITIMFKNWFFMLILIIIFIAITSAIMNSFGAMTTAYAIKAYKSRIEKK